MVVDVLQWKPRTAQFEGGSFLAGSYSLFILINTLLSSLVTSSKAFERLLGVGVNIENSGAWGLATSRVTCCPLFMSQTLDLTSWKC